MNSSHSNQRSHALQRRRQTQVAREVHPQDAQIARHSSDGFNPFGDPFSSFLVDPFETFPSAFGGSMLDSFLPGSFRNDLMNFSRSMTSGGNNGCHYSSVMVMNSTIGPDGKSHVEKYARSSASNPEFHVHELKEAYTNSASGIDKYAHEKKIGERGRRLTKERNRNTEEVVVNDEFYGMERTEDNVQQLEDEWAMRARRAIGAGAMIPGVDAPACLDSAAQRSSRTVKACKPLPRQ